MIKKDHADRDCKRLRRAFCYPFRRVICGAGWHNNGRRGRCLVLLRHVMFGNRPGFDAAAHAKPLSIMGACAVRDVSLPEYAVKTPSKPCGSPAELPRPRLIPNDTRISSRLAVQTPDGHSESFPKDRLVLTIQVTWVDHQSLREEPAWVVGDRPRARAAGTRGRDI